MDEKTAELRDIFLDVADEDTVTESQQEGRGSLHTDGQSIDERLERVIEQLDEKFDVTSDLSREERCQVVTRFYAGEDDETIADGLDRSVSEVFRARMGLHLVRDEDVPVDRAELRRRLDSDDDRATIASDLELDEEALDRASEALTAENQSRRVSHRFRTAFEERLTDADLTVQFAVDAHADGLEDATEGAEMNIDF